MADITESEWNLVQKFRNAAIEFRDALLALTNLQSSVAGDPELEAEYSELMSEGLSIKSTVEYLLDKVDSITGFFSNLLNGKPRGLGLVWLVPVAGITAAIAYMGKWVSDVYLFERRVTERKELEKTGLSSREAMDILNSGSLSSLVKPAAFVVGGFVLWKILENTNLFRR